MIGLVDDAGVLALTLYWLRNIIGIDPQIIKDNWVGENDLNDVIQDVHQRVNDNANKLFDGEIWALIRKKFDHSDNSPHQNQHEGQLSRREIPPQMAKSKVPIEIDSE